MGLGIGPQAVVAKRHPPFVASPAVNLPIDASPALPINPSALALPAHRPAVAARPCNVAEPIGAASQAAK